MEENFIYDDLVSQGDLGDIIHNLQKRKNELELHVASLEEDVKKLCDKITEMKAVQDNLSRNISELFKTAKNELNRKDRRIAELQAQLDDIVFRRNPMQSYDAHKRKREESNLEENKKPKIEHVEVSTKSINNSHDGPDKSVQKEDKRLIGTLNSNPHQSSRKETEREKTSYQRENTYKRGRSSQRKEDDSHRSVLDRVYPDLNSQHEYDHSGKTSYSRENSDRKDRNHDQRDKQDHYQKRHSLTDSRIDNRDRRLSRRDHSRDNNREHFRRDHKNSVRSHRDKSRDYRNSIKDNHRDSQQEFNRRGKNDTREEYTKRITDDNKNEPTQGNNQRSEKIEQLDHSGNEPMSGDPREEPVFSAAESSQTPSEDNSDKEDGELSDEDNTCVKKREKVVNSSKDKFKNQGEKSEQKSVNKDMDWKKNNRKDYLEENIRLENVPDSKNDIQKNELKQDKSELSCKENSKKHEKERGRLCTEVDSSKKIEADKVCTKKNIEENKQSQDKVKKPPTVENLSKKLETNIKEAKFDNEKNNVNVNIISQVILNKGVEQVPASSSNAKLVEHNKSQENKNKPSIIVPKLDRPKRESRVPRNLTDELNINLERSEKKQKLMSQLFGSSEKKITLKPFEQFSPTHTIGLNHEGEIPNLPSICSPDPREIKSDRSASNTSSNPVTEFQIFKTNLPSLEKSNSLPSIDVQIQTPDKSIRNKEVQSLEKAKPAVVDKSPVKHKEISEKCVSKQVLLSTPAITENVPQSSSDVCDLSFDLLNIDIAQYKAEDFPNLISLSSRDMSDLLLTPKAPTVKNITNKPSVKNLQHENKTENLNKMQPTEPEKQNELSEMCQKSDKNKIQLKEKSVPIEVISDVSRKTSNIKNKHKKQNVMKDETVENEISSKSPKECIIEKKSTTNTNTTVGDNIITNEKTSQELKNGQGSELEISEKSKTTEAKDISNKRIASVKATSNTIKRRKQNKSNVDKKTADESTVVPLGKSDSISYRIADVNKEPSGNTVTNSKNIKTDENSGRRRVRCILKLD